MKKLFLAFGFVALLALVNVGCSGSSPSGPAASEGAFGLNSSDGTNTTTTDHEYFSRYQLASQAHFTNIVTEACAASGSVTLNVGIFADNSGGTAPTTLITKASATIDGSVCAAPTTVHLTGSGITLDAGFYWLVVGSPQDTDYYTTAATGTNIAAYDTGDGSLPSPFSGPSTFSDAFAPYIYAD